jgi:predicted DNA-binding antitoxin AbrB/MazE fold protein
MEPVIAVFEHGVFRPKCPVDLPEFSEVIFEPRLLSDSTGAAESDQLFRILARRYESGIPDTAARHNDHLP